MYPLPGTGTCFYVTTWTLFSPILALLPSQIPNPNFSVNLPFLFNFLKPNCLDCWHLKINQRKVEESCFRAAKDHSSTPASPGNWKNYYADIVSVWKFEWTYHNILYAALHYVSQAALCKDFFKRWLEVRYLVVWDCWHEITTSCSWRCCLCFVSGSSLHI